MKHLKNAFFMISVAGAALLLAKSLLSPSYGRTPSPAKPQPSRVTVTALPKGAPYPDFTKNLATKGAFSQGALASATRYPHKVAHSSIPDWVNYLEFRQVTQGKVPGQTFQCDTIYQVFNPQTSPTGKTLLFKLGASGDRYDRYGLYFLDLATHRLTEGPQGICNLRVQWSPRGRYVSYIRGGDVDGYSLGEDDSLQLFVYDTQTQQEHMVAQSKERPLSTWASDETLLYSLLPPAPSPLLEHNASAKVREAPDAQTPRAATYEFSPQTRVSKLLLSNAFDPVISPDSKEIVFFGWIEKPKGRKVDSETISPHDQLEHDQLGLYKVERGHQERKLLRANFSHLRSTDLTWTPDGQKIVFLQTLSYSPHAKARVGILDVATKALSFLPTLQMDDFATLPRSDALPQFHLQGISTDSKYVYLQTSRFTGFDQKNQSVFGVFQLHAYDLVTGIRTLGLQTDNLGGDMEWRGS